VKAGPTDELIARARAGDRSALNELFAKYRDRLRRMVEMRLDWKLQARLDPSDIIQEAYLEVASRIDEYLRNPKLPLFLWLRLVVGEQLINLHRHHLGVQMRDPRREVSLYCEGLPEASSAALAERLLGRETSPAEAAVRAERMLRVQDALNRLEPMDREIISLRHFEQLSRSEAAQALGINEATAAKRHVRALARLKHALADIAHELEGL
jgi:RNA polymerase sigma-70 factor (ECF subfamily)